VNEFPSQIPHIEPVKGAEQVRQEKYQPLEVIVEAVIARITGEPKASWLKSAYRGLSELVIAAESNEYPPEVSEYITGQLKPMLEVLRGEFEVRPDESEEDTLKAVNERARAVIHEISDLLMTEETEHEPIGVQMLPMKDILNQELEHGYKLRQMEGVDGVSTLDIYSPTRDEWFSFPLPPTSQMIHKGGFPRVVLKLLAGAEVGTIESELPPNDFDVIAWGEESEAYRVAAQMGVDLSGVEVLKAEQPDLSELMRTRDLDLNSAFIGKDGLFYSKEAEIAAKTGHIEPIPSHRGLYGTNMLTYRGELLYSGRDMMRALKFVAEGKATSFSFKELNQQVDMGIYALVLAEKFMRKSQPDKLLDKLFHLLKQVGQVKEGEVDVYAVLERLHTEYPFVQMEDRGLPSDTEVSEWLLKKLGKQALHRFRSEYRIPSVMELERKPGDAVPYTVSMDGFVPSSPEESLHSLEQLQEFIGRCNDRRVGSLEPIL
jgi:hypothetical protein